MKRIIALSLLCAPVLPALTYAEDLTENRVESHAANYVGIAVSKLTSGVAGTGAAIMVGHHYNENLAVEVAYADSGAVNKTVEPTTVTSIAAVGFLPLAAGFEAYGRLGYAAAQTKDAAGLSASHSDITYGVGVEYSLNENYSLGLGWDRVRVGDNVVIPRANENSYALSLVRHF